MSALVAFVGQLLTLLLALYFVILGTALITNQQPLIGRLNRWILRQIGLGVRSLLKGLCKLLENLFRWLGSLF